MNRRAGPAPKGFGGLSSVVGEVVLEDKVQHLERTLQTFRAEVDLKMTIIEQILTTRNEQFFVQKKLLEREHALYESVMTHWKNTADLAASGLSIKFSDGGVDVDVIEFGQADESHGLGKRSAAAARRGRKKRLKTQYDNRMRGDSDNDENYSDTGMGEGDVMVEVPKISSVQTMVTGHRAGESDVDDDSDSAERKVFVEYYAAEGDHVKVGEKSTNKIWQHYMREEGGGSALCKLCDDQGIQRILKLQEGSTSTLHRHLRFKHKEMVEHKAPSAHSHHEPTSAGEFAIIPPRISVDGSRRMQSPIWNYFTKFKDGDTNKARCNVCFKDGTLTIQKISDGSTSRFHAHLRRAHGIDAKVTPIPPPGTYDGMQDDLLEGQLDGVEFSRVDLVEVTENEHDGHKLEPSDQT